MSTLETVIQTIQPYVIGAIGGAGSLFLTGFVKELFEERARKAEHKRNVAIQVHKICNEASTGNFKRPARDDEHVNSVMTDLDGIDEEMGVVMNRLVASWRLNTDPKKLDFHYPLESEKDHIERNRQIETDRNILVAWANKIRAGGKPR